MLIETPYKNGDVISMKLNSGEEVIAKLEDETETHVKVSKPLMVAATQQGLGLAPFMFTVSQESDLKLKASNVLVIAKTEKDMASQYIQSTTGLAV